MTANDHGHVNNLDRKESLALKESWVALTSAISSETSLPVKHIVDSDYGNELFCSIGYDNPDVIVLRWLRARKWDVDAAVQQMMDTLKWRLDWGVQALVAKGESELSQEEIMTGKSYFMGRDKAGRPINYFHIKDHIAGQFPQVNTEKLIVLSMETGRKLLEEPVEAATVIIDMAGLHLKNIDYQLFKFLINLLQNYYPESLGLGLILHTSWLFHSCWAVVQPWLDPVVESKIHFINSEADLIQYVDPSVIPKRLHGSHPDFHYTPPTVEDKAMLDAFQADNQGKLAAQAVHHEAARHYLSVTLQWAHGDDSHNVLAERAKAMERLKETFEKLVPYVSTRTYYHRIGAIKEPIFNIAYNKLRTSDEQSVWL